MTAAELSAQAYFRPWERLTTVQPAAGRTPEPMPVASIAPPEVPGRRPPSHYTRRMYSACRRAVVYFSSAEAGGRPCAIAYRLKRTKADWHHSFKTIEERDRYIAVWLEQISRNLAAQEERKAAQRAARHGGQHPFKVGDILTGSWGYDQTNQEIWGITRTKGKRVWIRPLACRDEGSSGHSNCLIPVKGKYLDKPEQMKIPQTYNGGESWYIKGECFSLSLWKGNALYETDSQFGH